MKEPSGKGPGCMLYPFEGCATEPRIDVHNITIRDLNSTGGFLPPGIIRGDESNPMTGINFEDVNIEGWWQEMNWEFITEYAHGSAVNVSPAPRFDKSNERVFELFSIDHFFDLSQELLGAYEVEKNDIQGW